VSSKPALSHILQQWTLWQVLAVYLQVSAVAAAAANMFWGASAAELIWLLRQAKRFRAYDKSDTPATRRGAASSKITAPACQADTQQHSSTVLVSRAGTDRCQIVKVKDLYSMLCC
jgi:hypothetical protein